MSVEADNYKDYQTTLVVSGNLKKEVVLEPVKKSILNNAAGNGGDIASLTMGVLVLVIFIIVIVGLVWRSKKRKENYDVRDEDTENLETEQQMIGIGEVNKEEDEITEKLGKLKELYEEGLITEEEYKERRRKLLDNL
ncbi:MAG: SHOCT domain-containing protein [Thermoplasmata archaeon]|nr:SHOCT domain-containing protein [Thermoplasmata archaeon]